VGTNSRAEYRASSAGLRSIDLPQKVGTLRATPNERHQAVNAEHGWRQEVMNPGASQARLRQLPPGSSLGLFGEDGLATLLVTSGVVSSEPSDAGGVPRTVVVFWPGEGGASSEHALATPVPHTTTMIALRIRE